MKTYAKVEAETQEEKFSKVYHALIHSPALDTLLNLEHTYSLTVEDLLRQRDADLGHLQQRYALELPLAHFIFMRLSGYGTVPHLQFIDFQTFHCFHVKICDYIS